MEAAKLLAHRNVKSLHCLVILKLHKTQFGPKEGSFQSKSNSSLYSALSYAITVCHVRQQQLMAKKISIRPSRSNNK